eukprot:CAMPEP_0119329430 /NCGR_PEP_ID=MMETSP1333-20130426/75829_2 /TAXON_ID=418940 /ORGANISM="Scyphosphaera apsteinii, Strain RCC1455" /LENGTH=85 /DNA_ID=CAMNT_0007338541 /DNA_START=923 /DNA_END=1180 /DNA_ORIENTATION=-
MADAPGPYCISHPRPISSSFGGLAACCKGSRNSPYSSSYEWRVTLSVVGVALLAKSKKRLTEMPTGSSGRGSGSLRIRFPDDTNE